MISRPLCACVIAFIVSIIFAQLTPNEKSVSSERKAKARFQVCIIPTKKIACGENKESANCKS